MLGKPYSCFVWPTSVWSVTNQSLILLWLVVASNPPRVNEKTYLSITVMTVDGGFSTIVLSKMAASKFIAKISDRHSPTLQNTLECNGTLPARQHC